MSRGPARAAGAPGPFERNTPAGSSERIAAAEVSAGTTTTEKRAASSRTIVDLMP